MSHNMKAHKSLVNSQLLYYYKLMGGYSISNAFSCPKSNVFRFKEEHPKCIKSKAQRNPREREKPFLFSFQFLAIHYYCDGYMLWLTYFSFLRCTWCFFRELGKGKKCHKMLYGSSIFFTLSFRISGQSIYFQEKKEILENYAWNLLTETTFFKCGFAVKHCRTKPHLILSLVWS